MSGKERDSLVVLERAKLGELKLSEAAYVLGICFRQCIRRGGGMKTNGQRGWFGF